MLQKRGRLAPFALAGAIVAAASTGAIVATRAHGSPPPSLSVFSDPSVVLPVDVSHESGFLQNLAQPIDARLALIDGADRYYVIRGRNDTTCLYKIVSVESVGPVASGTCGPTSILAKDSIFVMYPQPDGTIDVAGIVKDGFTSASVDGGPRGTARHNVFVIHRARPFAYLDLNGPAGSAHVYEGAENIKTH